LNLVLLRKLNSDTKWKIELNWNDVVATKRKLLN